MSLLRLDYCGFGLGVFLFTFIEREPGCKLPHGEDHMARN